VVPNTAVAVRELDPRPARTGVVARIGVGTAAARSFVVRVVVAHPEEPHEPRRQKPEVEDAQADHQDPAFGRHGSMVEPVSRDAKGRDGGGPPVAPTYRPAYL
jgi:hypothetical protein